MASKGDLFLNNAAVIGLYDTVKAYETTVQDAFYSEYRNAYKLSVSNYFRGKAADSFKSYLTNGAINIICGLLDISSEMSMFAQMLAEGFFQYEQNHTGCVEEGALDYIVQQLTSKETVYDGTKSELTAVTLLASNYINVKPLGLDSINAEYSNTKKCIKEIREGLYAVDNEALKTVDELFQRIKDMNTLVEKIMEFCYTDDGKLAPDNLPKLTKQGWFEKAGNVTLYLLLQEDPFEYAAGEVSISENQWATGLCSDVYAYAGYSFLAASGEAGIEDGTAFAKGKAAVFGANGYAQFTNYLSAQANLDVIFAEGEVKAGWSDKYKGFKVDAEVGLLKMDGTVMVGSDDLNAFVKGEVKVLCADGKAAFEFEEDGQFAIGVDASATLASASVKGGTTILGYKNKDSATGEEKPLLGFSASASADAGGKFAIWAESKTAYETKHMNINATTVEIGAEALLGLDLSITIPTPYFKW